LTELFGKPILTNQSREYIAKREELRRHLPQGAAIQDYRFEEGPRHLNAGDAPARTVRLGELFTQPNRSLVIYDLMYGKRHPRMTNRSRQL
jgi:predicted dithiol-disulfide oxidoreductase (DUF899 family)